MNYSTIGYYYPQHDSDLHNNNKVSQNMEYHTRPAFEAMEKLIMTFRGLHHTLESTFMATHSGFSALLQLTHQIRTVKRSVGHVFGLLSFLRWIKNKLLSSKKSQQILFSVKEFEQFNHNKFAKTPLVLFVILTVGVPMLVHLCSTRQAPTTKCIDDNHQKSIELTLEEKMGKKKNGKLINPKKLDFARAVYSFQAENSNELSLQPNDLVAILSKESGDWWRGRLKNGKVGYFPANHVEIIEKKAIVDSTAIAPSA